MLGFSINVLSLLGLVLAIGIVTFYSFFAHKYLSFNAGILAPLKKLLDRTGRGGR